MSDPHPGKLPSRRHLLIGGTGRAGTSFLVKYLTELGLDTHLTKHGANAYWDAEAHAGLEDMPLVGDGKTLPYVVKSPYAYQFIDALLARDDIQIDGVIIPIRDLIAAASSRTLTEMQHLHRVVPWLPELDQTWEQWALTPGGAVYSLAASDQARLLAVGLHHLVQRLVQARIRISLIHFPEMIVDPDYLFRQLKCFLPPDITIETARQAHARIANRDEVRVGDELNGQTASAISARDQRVDNRRLRDQIRQEIETARNVQADLAKQIAQNVFNLGRLSEDLTRCADQCRLADAALAMGRLEINTHQRRATELGEDIARAENELARLRNSAWWRYTMPLRAVHHVFQTLFK